MGSSKKHHKDKDSKKKRKHRSRSRSRDREKKRRREDKSPENEHPLEVHDQRYFDDFEKTKARGEERASRKTNSRKGEILIN